MYCFSSLVPEYQASNADELALKENEHIEIIGDGDGDGWLQVSGMEEIDRHCSSHGCFIFL